MGARWQERARCRLNNPEGLDPDLWFPEPGKNGQGIRAKQLCMGCPVRVECLREALDITSGDLEPQIPDLSGVWGGTTASDRVRMRRARQRGAVAA